MSAPELPGRWRWGSTEGDFIYAENAGAGPKLVSAERHGSMGHWVVKVQWNDQDASVWAREEELDDALGKLGSAIAALTKGRTTMSREKPRNGGGRGRYG